MTIKILIADDEILFQRVINYFFNQKIKEGLYEFHYAINGKEAFEKLASGLKIDIVLVDIRMPEMDGLTLIKKLNEKGVPAKTIIISAYPDILNIRKAMNEGTFDFLVKPIDLNELEESIDKLFQLKKQSTKLARPAETKQAGKIKSLLSDPSSQKITPSIAYKIAKQLQVPQQIGVINRLIENFNVEEIDDLKYKIESQEYIALERQEKREEIAQEVYERLGLDKQKLPLLALEQGYIEERVVKRKSASGEIREPSIHLYLRWTDKGCNGYYLGPASALDEKAKTILSIMGYSQDEKYSTQALPKEDVVEPPSNDTVEIKHQSKSRIRLSGRDFKVK